MSRKFKILTPDMAGFYSKLKTALYACRDAECFSVIMGPESQCFTVGIQADINKAASKTTFVLQEHHFFAVYLETRGIIAPKHVLIGKCRSSELGIKMLHSYIHSVMGGIFCKREIPNMQEDPPEVLPKLELALLPAAEDATE